MYNSILNSTQPGSELQIDCDSVNSWGRLCSSKSDARYDDDDDDIENSAGANFFGSHCTVWTNKLATFTNHH